MNAPYCDCCTTPGQWFAEHIDPSGLVKHLSDFPINRTNLDWVNKDRLENDTLLTIDDLRKAKLDYLRRYQNPNPKKP